MTIAIEILVLAAVLLALICIGVGYWWASASQKRASGGKSVKQLAEEKEAYQEQVVEHFKTTAELLNEMTDKYRDVYRHMAEGAQSLASSDSASPALAALQTGLLAAPNTTPQNPAESIIESSAASEPVDSGAPQTDNAGSSASPESGNETGITPSADDAAESENTAPNDTDVDGTTESEVATKIEGDKPEFFSNEAPQAENAESDQPAASDDADDKGIPDTAKP